MSIIAIVGSGLIGRAWAISFARCGHNVRLFDEAAGVAAAALEFATSALPMLKAEDLLEGQTVADVAARLSLAQSLEVALDSAVHCQESTPEVLDVKKVVYEHLDAIAAPDVVLVQRQRSCRQSSLKRSRAGGAALSCTQSTRPI